MYRLTRKSTGEYVDYATLEEAEFSRKCEVTLNNMLGKRDSKRNYTIEKIDEQ